MLFILLQFVKKSNKNGKIKTHLISRCVFKMSEKNRPQSDIYFNTNFLIKIIPDTKIPSELIASNV